MGGKDAKDKRRSRVNEKKEKGKWREREKEELKGSSDEEAVD